MPQRHHRKGDCALHLAGQAGEQAILLDKLQLASPSVSCCRERTMV